MSDRADRDATSSPRSCADRSVHRPTCFAARPVLVIALLLLGAATLRAQDYSVSGASPDTAGYIVRELAYNRHHVDVSIAYPVITRFPRTLRRTLNGMLLREARSAFAETRDMLKGMADEFTDGGGLYGERSVRAWFEDSTLVSVLYSWSEYSGGAHPGGYYQSKVYRVADGRIREVTLAELFRAGSGYDTVLADLVAAEIKRSDPDGVFDLDELREGFRESGLGCMAITGHGLLFADWPGAHVDGPTETLITWDAIAPYLDPRGPLGRHARS